MASSALPCEPQVPIGAFGVIVCERGCAIRAVYAPDLSAPGHAFVDAVPLWVDVLAEPGFEPSAQVVCNDARARIVDEVGSLARIVSQVE